MNTPQQTEDIVFLMLFVAYAAQFLFIGIRLRRGSLPKISGEIWFFIALSVIVPLLLGVMPDLLLKALQSTGARAESLTLTQVGVKFMLGYLIIIVTLELALQIQSHQQRKENAWVGFLITNLGFDILSILVFHFVNAILERSVPPVSDRLVSLFFGMCAAPTIATGVLVVCGSYSALSARE